MVRTAFVYSAAAFANPSNAADRSAEKLDDLLKSCLKLISSWEMAARAARELQEETGLCLGAPPDLSVLDYLCRAVTPTSRPMRFNARFLIAPADAVRGNIISSGELEELGFYSAAAARAAKMASITEVIMEEFLAWHAMPPTQRAGRRLVRILGLNARMAEREPAA